MLKKINKHFYKIVFLAFFTAIVLSFTPLSPWRAMNEVFIFFPEDDNVYFKEARTSLELLSKKDDDEYSLRWAFASETNKPAFLRKDMSIVFENGVFKGAKMQSLQEQLFIEEITTFDGEDSGRYDALTFHHAELHYEKDIYKSKHAWSKDHLYVSDSPLAPLSSFKEPLSAQEKESQQLLDTIINQQLDYVLEGLLEEFHINSEEYDVYSLLDLPDYAQTPLPGLNEKETFATLGRLWEGFYRYYILGINTFTEETYSPIGNSLPHVLIHQDGTHLLLVYEMKDGTRQQLLQMIDEVEAPS
ncbi:hypothetical protein HXA34_08795 [Salipaludibacillus agaradhaerens]|uniref:hypothetical protein n=1 Tax=Salipaludibacillus agaradhaerens TaxID=76935 RepID=UPI0021507AB4|nr:hypothetical protein [Salipaludibacillus agaradhaerens]MCR6106376.1 hypothetical protein [Salipaludibacillus agaradhaerens]MCR6118409.1 hypothetical protein [Salipaludibacillus agaradhaerens]UJW57515.1 hypothetical protein HXZ66_08920 [Bacillus sp. A116_S68]